MASIKNTKRAMSAFFNFAVCMPAPMLVAFLESHGFPAAWDLGNVKALANKIGATEAHTQLETIRKTWADALVVKRAAMLDAARSAWVKGDPRAFDAITW